MDRIHRIIAIALVTVLAIATGCASSAWRQALREDAPAGYYRFLRDHPDSKYTEEANARLEFHRIKRRPSLEALYAFNEAYPEQTELLSQLRPLLEEKAFDVARAQGTPEAYDRFTENFPSGALGARAAGNAAYLRANGFGGDTAQLAAFAAAHPESDFAEEARRSAESPTVRARTRFDRVGLRVRIAPGTPDADRLITSFTHEALEQYREVGVELVPLDGLRSASGAALPLARLTIVHGEQAVQTVVADGEMSPPGVVATTRVTLTLGAESAPIWDREFSVRSELRDHVEGASLLLGPAGRRYWSEFFVPVSRWQTNAALRSMLNLPKEPVAVDGQGDRAVVAYADGDFQVIDLADPTNPAVLAQHTRERDLKTFDGVRVLGDRIAVFGDDGLEIVRFGAAGSETVLFHDRGTIGTVVAVERLGDGLVIGSNRGLMLSDADAREPMRVLRRDIQGVAVSGDILLFTDGSSVFVANLPLLRQNRVLAQLRLGREFDPGRVRVFGNRAIVLGATGALLLDLSNPGKPVTLAQLHTRKIGEVSDAARIGELTYLVGDRGLMVFDDEGGVVRESVDVVSRDRIDVMGRHIVAIGGGKLQVVDGTPFRAAGATAAPAP
ncbi:MAG: hypothetical protein ACQGVK_04540 [Myxococcota bacterium]